MQEKDISQKEIRIRKITRIYYTKPQIQQTIFEFSMNREVIPRYFEEFGKRPDTINYPADIKNLVLKGATSFHSSEELWKDPLQIKTDLSQEEMAELRIGWDLLIDIDSPYLDYSKIATGLLISVLEAHGIKNYGIKFSGNKGFHIIVPWGAFPEEFNGEETRKMFPEWPRAITSYLLEKIRSRYNEIISKQDINFNAIEQRTNISKDELVKTLCPRCNSPVKKKNTYKIKVREM